MSDDGFELLLQSIGLNAKLIKKLDHSRFTTYVFSVNGPIPLLLPEIKMKGYEVIVKTEKKQKLSITVIRK